MNIQQWFMESYSILLQFKENTTVNLQMFGMISSDIIYSLVSPLSFFFLTRCMFNSTMEKNSATFSVATLQQATIDIFDLVLPMSMILDNVSFNMLAKICLRGRLLD